jgi:membrane protease YdiL (CAAX protease family)
VSIQRNPPVRLLTAVFALLSCPALAAQDTGAVSSRPASPRPLAGAEIGIPLGSFLVPGLGQYLQGAPLLGAGFTGAAVAGYALYLGGDQDAASAADLPHDAAGQRAYVGAVLATAAGGLSAYDSFHRSLASLQQQGKYRFVTAHDSPGSLFLAPFDVRMLQRWTTWIDLAQTAAVVALVLHDRTPGGQYLPFQTRDGVFVASLAYNTGVGEEALFRGWLYPMLHQKTGGHMWLSNGLQATVFGALHIPRAKGYAVVIAGWAFWEGWLTRRNGWSVRESVFHHFWHNVAVGAAELLTQEQATLTIAFPVMRF